MNASERAFLVKERALELGFAAVGIADLSPNSHGEQLRRWLSNGMAATMGYMHRQAERRLEPSRILPGANRCVVVLRNHFSADPPTEPRKGRVAKYARGIDYHEALKKPLQQLADYVCSLGDKGTVARPYVDAGPVPERELAQRAGLGWIGRSSMLINPKIGSNVFVAVVLTNLEITLDEPFSRDLCGRCNRCVERCPTGAINPGRLVDSRRCVSYLTIEHKGEIAEELRAPIGDWILGCDICQNVCPWNEKFARVAEDALLQIETTKALEDLDALLALTADDFDERFANTAFERPGLLGVRRNAGIALENSTAGGTRSQMFTYPSGDG